MKKIAALLIIIGLLAGLFTLYQRVNIEQNMKQVELVLDAKGLNELSSLTGKSKLDLLKIFKEAGLTSVALYPKTVAELVEEGKLNLFTGDQILGVLSLSSGLNPPFSEWVKDGFSSKDYVYFSAEEELVDWLAGFLREKDTGFSKTTTKGFTYLLVRGEEFKPEFPLGFAPAEINLVRESGLKITPRFMDYPGFSPSDLDKWIEDIEDLEWGTVIFAGNRVAGYPAVSPVILAEKLQGRVLGFIEPFIAYQEGIKELVSAAGLSAARVHSIQQKEMDKYSFQKVVDRYIRAVRERDVTVLYLKPFLAKKDGADLVELNRKFISGLTTELKEMGFSTGAVRPFPLTAGSRWNVLLLSLGVIAGGYLLLVRFLPSYKVVLAWLSLLAFLASGLLLVKGYVLFTRELVALGAATVFPSLAGIFIIDRLLLNERTGEKLPLVLIKATLISLAGGLFVAGLLFDTRYFLKVNQFRGVKISFILPLLLVTVYLLLIRLNGLSLKRVQKMVLKLFEEPLRWKHVISAAVLGILGIIYIGRTGNFPLFPVPPWELWLREILEDIFVIRPRFKEFFLGYPAFFVLGLTSSRIKSHFWNWFFLLLTMMGQVNIVNTFSHIHTPLLVSLWRSTGGLILGLLTGLIVYFAGGLLFDFVENNKEGE